MNRDGEKSLSKYIVLFLFLFPLVCLSQNLYEKEDIQQSDILDRFEALKKSNINEFLKEMESVNKIANKYIEKREEECSGVYSTITTNEKGEQIEQKKKLSRKEKKLCKYLLVNFQVKMTKIAFELRKSYLKALSQKQIEQLDQMSKKRLAELESLAQKYK